MQDCAATRSPHQGSSGSWGRAEHDIAAASYASRGLGGLCTDACDPDADADADADACCAGDSACSPIRSRSRHGRRSRSRSAGDGHVRSPDRDVYAASNPDGSCSPSSSVDNPDVLFFKHTLSPLQSSSRRSILSQQLHDLDLGSPALRCCPPDCRPGPADPHAPDAACCSPLAHDRDLGRDSARTSGSGSGGELHDASGSPARCCGRCGPGCCAGDDADADIDADVRSVSGAASATSSASATRDTSSVESASHMGSANTPFDPTLSPFMHPEDRCHHRTGHHHCTHDSHAPHHPQSLAGTLHHHTDRHQHLAFQPVPLLSQHPGTPIRRRLTLADMKAAHNQPAAAQHHPQPVQGRGAVHRLDQGPEHDHAHGDHHRDDQGLDPNDHLRHRPHAAARDGDRDSALGSSPIASPRPLRPAGAFMEPLDPLLRLRLPRLRCNSWEGAPRFPSLSPNLERAGSASHHQHHQHHHIHHHHNHHRHCHCQHCHDWRRQRHLKECEEATLRVLDSASAEAW
ncbi:hypothetical protein HK105_205954 [Polyrhizophydium stewartii]|uniref:Uncharacterized protein n=1 Tax=Polyrhizophydium stewartii TaxID=2732419 RepID=A0ABR4N4Y8_9FUNG